MRDADITEVAALINACWRTVYVGILDAQFLDGLTTPDQVARLQARQAAGGRGIVARTEGSVNGVTLFGPTHLADEAPLLAGAGEIHQLYVRTDLIGTGLGHQLLGAAEADLYNQGYDRIGLDVFAANLRAIQFYERHGYKKVGSKVDVFPDHVVPLDIMAK